MDPRRDFIGRVIDGGRITIPKDVRKAMGIEDGNYVYVNVEKLDLFKISMHRFYRPERTELMTKKQVSATKFE